MRMQTDPHDRRRLVPHMVLQPIVENAIRHGLGQSEEAVAIDIEARQRDGPLVLDVSRRRAGRCRRPRCSVGASG